MSDLFRQNAGPHALTCRCDRCRHQERRAGWIVGLSLLSFLLMILLIVAVAILRPEIFP